MIASIIGDTLSISPDMNYRGGYFYIRVKGQTVL